MVSPGQVVSVEPKEQTTTSRAYQVLARTYRPRRFESVIGQDDCVRILTHALRSHRVGHAFLFVGERGVGKTTLARLLAKALNCTGAPEIRGSGGVDPCEVCEACREIALDQQLDILEMDAASHTGVDDIRAIIEGARYRPATLTFKVFIIDEVHMLSKSAFNALLKTLEEPPPHVKFIFATTEVHKIPLTIRSRCQFFDLKRVDQSTLEAYFAFLAKQEGVSITPGALKLIARGADGSVRDGLSLLDHAFHYGNPGEMPQGIQESHIRTMFGLCDRTDMIDLYQSLMKGDQEKVLSNLDNYVSLGQDPLKILQDLLEICYQLTRYKCSPSYDLSTYSEEIIKEIKNLSSRLSMEVLQRTWQVLVKGVDELKVSDVPQLACGMVLMRLMYIKSGLFEPLPEKKIVTLEREELSVDPPKERDSGGKELTTEGKKSHLNNPPRNGDHKTERGQGGAFESAMNQLPQGPSASSVDNFRDVMKLLRENKEMRLYSDLYTDARFVRLEGETLTVNLTQAPKHPSFSKDLEKALSKHTQKPWVVMLSETEPGDRPLHEQDVLLEGARRDYVASNPVVKEVIKTFPESRIEFINQVKEE